MSELPAFLTDPGLRLLLFGGKGGVGKTTCAVAAALALALRHPAETFVLVSTDPAHSLRDSLADDPLPPNLSIVEFQADEAMGAFLREHRNHFREIARRGTFLADEEVDRFTELSLPGVDEFLAALQISRWLADPRCDRIIADTAPTGHTLRLIETPELMAQWLVAMEALVAKHRYMRSLFVGRHRPDEVDSFLEEWSDSARRLKELLRDRTRCRFVPVMTADRLSVLETSRLLAELAHHALPVSEIVVNRSRARSPAECASCAEDRRSQLEELRALPSEFERYSLWAVPLHPREVRGSRMLSALWSEARPLSVGELEAVEPSSPGLPTRPRVENAARLPPPRSSLLAFAGKGGVGKTTLAAAAALRFAREFPCKRVLLCSSDPAHSLSDCLETSIGARPVKVTSNLSALEIDGAAALEALKEQYSAELERALSTFFPALTLPFDRRAMEKLMDLAPPGVDEVMALAEVARILDEEEQDLVVLDTAPTGHFLRLLEAPEVVEEWLRSFLDVLLKYGSLFQWPKLIRRASSLSRNVRHFRKLVVDPERAAVYSVTILTEMAFEETRDLVAACERKGVSVPLLFLNLATAGKGCPGCRGRRRGEVELRGRFGRAFPAQHQVLVRRGESPRGLKALEALGDELFARV